MANPDIQEKIASLPDDVMVEFSTTSASARAYDKISDQPMLYLYSKDSDGYYIPQKAHIFHTDSSLMLDTKSADKWFDSI